jgi:kinetochore protein Nuf2
MLCLSREEQQQPVFMAIDALEFPELHDESIPYMTFVRNCTKLLNSAGVRDFNMQVGCC